MIYVQVQHEASLALGQTAVLLCAALMVGLVAWAFAAWGWPAILTLPFAVSFFFGFALVVMAYASGMVDNPDEQDENDDFC